MKTSSKKLKESVFNIVGPASIPSNVIFPMTYQTSGVDFNALYVANEVSHDVRDTPETDDEAAKRSKKRKEKRKKEKMPWSDHIAICLFVLFYFLYFLL